MDWKHILNFFSFESLFERSFSTFILSIGKEENWSNFIGVFSFFNSFNSEVKTWTNVGSSSCRETVNVLIKRDHILRCDTFESTNSFTPTFKGDDWKSVGRSKSFKKVFHGASDEFDFFTHHGATDINNTDEIDTGSGSSFSSQWNHGRQHNFLF